MYCVISYNTYTKYARKYNLKRYTDNGQPITFNKLKKKVENHRCHKVKQLTKKQQIHNSIVKYICSDINDDDDLFAHMVNYVIV